MKSMARLGYAAIGFAIACALTAITVGVQLYLRGIEVDDAGSIGFITPAESILLIGGAAAALIAALVGLLILRRSRG